MAARWNNLVLSLLATTMISCAAPDQRSYEDGWRVFTNQCGDVSSKVRIKESYQTSYKRDITLYDQDGKRIYVLDQLATRAGITSVGKTFANDVANEEVERRKLNRNDIDIDVQRALKTYFDPPEKNMRVDFGCLMKGIRST